MKGFVSIQSWERWTKIVVLFWLLTNCSPENKGNATQYRPRINKTEEWIPLADNTKNKLIQWTGDKKTDGPSGIQSWVSLTQKIGFSVFKQAILQKTNGLPL